MPAHIATNAFEPLAHALGANVLRVVEHLQDLGLQLILIKYGGHTLSKNNLLLYYSVKIYHRIIKNNFKK
jgi:hypothetical protein